MEKKENMRKLLIGLCIILIDQLSKSWVEKNIPFTEYFEINNFFKIVHFQNTGAAFSFLDSASGWQNNFFILLTLAILTYLINLYRQNISSPYGSISIMLIMSGAIGNLIDRFSNGHVTDFIYLHINEYYWPAFNVADSAITIGAIIYLLGLLKGKIK
jgi:signal peptidase II